MALSFKEKREAQVSLNTSLTRLSSGGLSFKDKRTEQGNVATQLSILAGTPTSSSTLYDQLHQRTTVKVFEHSQKSFFRGEQRYGYDS